jgi:dipeptidyl aminopeptidase/acylaminoacyl peptidase
MEMRYAPLASIAVAVLSAGVVVGPAVAQVPATGGDALPVDLLLEVSPVVGGETPRWSPDGSRILFSSGFGGLMSVPAGGGFPRKLPVGLGEAGHFLASQTPRWSPDGQWVSFISDRSGAPEVWIWSTETGESRQLTRLGGRLIDSYRWSPDGASLALATDRHGNMDVWRVSVPDGRATRLTDDRRYEVQPFWSPDGESLLYVRLDSTWSEHTILELPASGGEARTIARDTGFFDYGGGGDFGPPRVSPDGEQVLFPSHRSGWINYWIVPRSGGEARRIAPEEADQSHARWSPDGSRVTFVSNRNGTQVLRVVSAGGGDAHTLASPPGMGLADDPEWSPDGTHVSYTLETPTSPRDLHVVRVADGEARRLARSLPEGGLDDRLVPPEKVSYESTDGLTIHGYLYRPPGVRAGDGHPALLWIHGGPTSQWKDAFQQHVQYFVQRGYVVLLPNIRGSSGYGKDFEHANNGCWNHCDLEDVVRGADFVRDLPYVDEDAVGITGTSYGGIMTMSAVAFAPGEFQAAVSQSGYADWVAFMEGGNELRHQKLLEYELGPYPENRDVYRHISSIRTASEAETPIFIVHGEGRYPGSPQSRMFAAALQEHYKPFRYKAYTGETYYVYGRENRRQLLLDMEAFLDFYLRGEETTLPGVRHVPEGGR